MRTPDRHRFMRTLRMTPPSLRRTGRQARWPRRWAWSRESSNLCPRILRRFLPDVDESLEDCVRRGRREHRLTTSRETIAFPFFARTRSMQEDLTDRHARIDLKRHLSHVGQLKR